MFLPGVLAIFVPLIYGLFIAENLFSKFGPALVIQHILPWVCLAAIGSIVFVSLVVYRYLISQRYIALYQTGIVIHQGTNRIYPWDHVKAIQSGTIKIYFLWFKIKETCRCTIFFKKGNIFNLPKSINNLPDLISNLKKNIYPHVYPSLQENFSKGKWLYFGPLKIQENNFEFRGRQAPWKLVNRITINSGTLVIELSNHKSLHIPICGIPNFELLLQILNSGVWI